MTSPSLARRWRQLAAAAVLTLTAGVIWTSPSTAQAATTYTVTAKGESYGPNLTEAVTVFRPSATGRRPVAYFIHGGSWVGGSRGQWATQASDWASHGWVAINIDYTRPAKQGDGALVLTDVTTVVNRFEAQTYTDKTRQIMIGDSSGGHLASTIAAKMPGHFKGVIAWSPVASPATAAADGLDPAATPGQVTLGAQAQTFFGFSARTTSAFRYITMYGGPPMWIAGSQDETLVPWLHQGAALCTALRAACTGHLLPGVEHGLTLRDNHPELEADAYSWAMHQIGAWK